MSELLPVLVVTLVGAGLVALCARGFQRSERRWVALAFLMHVAFACAQVPIAYGFYGGSDMFHYFSYGEILAQMMHRDSLHVMPEVTALLLQQPHRLPIWIIGSGTATGTMSALAAFAFYVIGPSKYAAGIAFSVPSLCGKIAMYRVFRAHVDPSMHRLAAFATLFVPSFVFWSAGVVKEAVAIAGFGWALYGVHSWLHRGPSPASAALVALGSIPILLIKPYIVFPFAISSAAWLYWARSLRTGGVRVRPAYALIASVLGVGGIVLLGQYFPEYSVDTFSERAYELQQIGRGIRGGGSNFMLSSEVPTTLVGQLAYSPFALLASLFRPAIFEVSNVLMLANAIETTILTLLLGRVLLTRNFSSLRAQIASQPFLVFCLIFVVSFGIAVGLTSTNLGTLSRYRSPILPFFAVLLLVLAQRRPHHADHESSHLGPEPALSKP